MRLFFFATPCDLTELLQALEAKYKLSFASMGEHGNKREVSGIPTLVNPELGCCSWHSDVGGPSYLVLRNDDKFIARPHKGNEKYLLYVSDNPRAISLRTGGKYTGDYKVNYKFWDDKTPCILQGEIASVSKDSESEELYKIFSAAIKKQFVKIGSCWVGKEAQALRGQGWRLTQSVTRPRECDL